MWKIEDIPLSGFYADRGLFYQGLAILIVFAGLGIALQREELWPMMTGFGLSLLVLVVLIDLRRRLSTRGTQGLYRFEQCALDRWLTKSARSIHQDTSLE
jgi:hypothetical protein